MTLTIPAQKWAEITHELQLWLCKDKASLKEVQRLTGLLNFACRCVRSGRVYLSRILNFLRTLPKHGNRIIPQSVREDVQWWLNFAQHHNGTSLISEKEWSALDQTLRSDSCLTGGSGFNEGTSFIGNIIPSCLRKNWT